MKELWEMTKYPDENRKHANDRRQIFDRRQIADRRQLMEGRRLAVMDRRRQQGMSQNE